MNTINIISNSLSIPSKVFESLTIYKGKAWGILCLIFGLVICNYLIFFGQMSPEWIVEQQILLSGNVSATEATLLKKNLMKIVDYTGIIAIFSEIGLNLLIISLLASYYYILGKMTTKYKYSDWFAFTVITQIPQIINSLGFLALYLTSSNTDLPFSLINYSSVNQIILGLPTDNNLYNWAESFGLFTFWSIALSTLGLSQWLGLEKIKSLGIAIFPYCMVLIIWALLT